jgi:hypothetical protein
MTVRSSLWRRAIAITVGGFAAAGLVALASAPARAGDVVAGCHVTAGTGCASAFITPLTFAAPLRLAATAPDECGATWRIVSKTTGAIVASGSVEKGSSQVAGPFSLEGVVRLEVVDACVGASAELSLT